MEKKVETIRKIRNYTGVTLKTLGEMIGLTGSALSKYESGVSRISEETIHKICDALKVDEKVFDDPDHIEKYCHYIPVGIDYDGISERVRELRKDNKMTQREFANHCGCSYSILTKIEQNITNPTDGVLQTIADGFDVGLNWLKYGDETVHQSPVNKKLIDWLNDHQEVRDELWKKMKERK